MSDIWIWTVRATDPAAAAGRPDLGGYRVEANDGHIGEVDEAVFDAGSGCLIVDTGFWIFGKRRMIPAGTVERIDDEAREIHLSCPKSAVREAPDYEPHRAGDPEHRRAVEGAFDPSRDAGMQGDPIGPQPGPGR